MTEKVSLAFYSGGEPDEAFINKLTRWLTGEYVHCEIVFEDADSPKHNASCSVWAGESVFYKPKTFGRAGWSYLSIQVPQEKAKKMKHWCKEQAALNLPFNSWGFYRALTPFPRRTDGSCWFCSELCTACLQIGGYLEGSIPSTMTPTHLHKMISKLPHFVGASPVFRERIAQKGLKLKNNGMLRRGSSDPPNNIFSSDTMLTKKWVAPV